MHLIWFKHIWVLLGAFTLIKLRSRAIYHTFQKFFFRGYFIVTVGYLSKYLLQFSHIAITQFDKINHLKVLVIFRG